MKVYAIIAVVIVSLLGLGGKYLYSLGYETAEQDLKDAQIEAIAKVTKEKDAEREKLEKKLTADFAVDLRTRDDRLRQLEDFLRTRGGEACSTDERDELARVAVGLEQVAIKALRYLEAERQN